MKNQRIKKVIQGINELSAKIKKNITLMEVCGTHTQVVSRYGIRKLIPRNIKLISGPGCPVCITPQEDVDLVVSLALAKIPIAAYGDVMRVPGCFGSLENAKSKGAKVFMVYSVEDALILQKEYPNLVFWGIGFETTAPMTAFAIQKGLCVFSSHRLFLPAMETLIKMGEIKIDGFINPGHVSTIIGIQPYKKIKASQVITGFEPEDVLIGIYMLLRQIYEKRADVENEYSRSVKENGNCEAMKLIFEVFEPIDGNWRGFGIIPKSGLKIKNKYKNFDAKIKYKKNILSKIDFQQIYYLQNIKPCICNQIIRGLKTPKDCPLFKRSCTPENPIGPCMVSVEGSCNVEFKCLLLKKG